MMFTTVDFCLLMQGTVSRALIRERLLLRDVKDLNVCWITFMAQEPVS